MQSPVESGYDYPINLNIKNIITSVEDHLKLREGRVEDKRFICIVSP
jgi:hypothetical protein